MAKLNFVKNDVTGRFEANLVTKLMSTPPAVDALTQSYTNAKGEVKQFGIVTVEFENAKGEKQLASAAIAKKNLEYGVTKGENYLSRVTIAEDGSAYISMSHLTGAARATAADFGFEDVTGAGVVKTTAQQTADVNP
jgi:hypothetical protein